MEVSYKIVLKTPWAQKRMFWAFEKSIFQIFCKFLSDEVKTVFWESQTMLRKLSRKVCFFGVFLENGVQSLFDHSTQSLLEFLNISNVLNVSIWIFNWNYNSLQNIWHKIKKSSKLEQDFKNLLLYFACFFTAIVKV